jgi:hypothetical protein
MSISMPKMITTLPPDKAEAAIRMRLPVLPAEPRLQATILVSTRRIGAMGY